MSNKTKDSCSWLGMIIVFVSIVFAGTALAVLIIVCGGVP